MSSHPHSAAHGETRTAPDPVCGMRVDPAKASGGALVHEGVEYAFCSPHCRKAYDADPARYLVSQGPPGSSLASGSSLHWGELGGAGEGKKEGEQSQAGAWRSQGGQEIYTCPMHPEIEQVGPGDCPICGMALEPKVVSASATEAEKAELRDMTRRFWAGVSLTVPIVLLEALQMVPSLDLPLVFVRW